MSDRPPAKEPYRFGLSFQSSPLMVRHALSEVMSCLQKKGVREKDCGVFELALAEVLNNIVEHAYEGSDTGSITLSITIWNNSLNCEISDIGKAMPNLSLPVPKQKELNVGIERLPEGGWGWMMIRELSDSITYQRTSGRNKLAFQMGLDQA
ncbi:ATP-binding protein [Halocynthiibacter sp. C4]|uniref:ATP-binding protein n=1 Tax=Halocynthiibacter sp. C4 TaxID=2992758 RepID=UPI00237AD404|nr:ATP-binding protein [Halocynthiibacter sp. C4]MDE0591094.1 ATP-binding protein [Halocynthiibacter sp. C4]